MHLHPALRLVPARLVPEGIEIEIGTQLAIDPHEKIAVEVRSHALGIVIGGDQDVRALFQIDAEYQKPVRSQLLGGTGQEGLDIGIVEIADGGTGKEADPARPRVDVGQWRRHEEIADDGMDGQVGIILLQERFGLGQHVVGHVDRHIAGRRLQSVEQDPRLHRGSCSVLDQNRARPDPPRQVGRCVGQDRSLGARGIVFRQHRDVLEQVRAARIVEQARGQRLLAAGKAFENIVQHDFSAWGDLE